MKERVHPLDLPAEQPGDRGYAAWRLREPFAMRAPQVFACQGCGQLCAPDGFARMMLVSLNTDAVSACCKRPWFRLSLADHLALIEFKWRFQ